MKHSHTIILTNAWGHRTLVPVFKRIHRHVAQSHYEVANGITSGG